MRNDYEKGKYISFEVYVYDDNGRYLTYKKEGTIVQVTDYFIVINNGFYNESFKFSEMIKEKKRMNLRDAYNLDEVSYEDDIIEKCINMVKKGKEGYVFTYDQLNKVIEKFKYDDYSIRQEGNICFIKI